MRKRGVIVIAVAVVVALGGLLASVQVDKTSRERAYIYANNALRSLGLGVRKRDVEHMRLKSGMQDISNVNCRDCHWASTNQLAWAKPRPHHRSPEALAVSPDGRELFVALTDVDEVAVVDTAARRVSRKVKLPGGPAGLALDPTGQTLYVTCRHADQVVALDPQSLARRGRVDVGLLPVGIAVCRTQSGDRLIVANTGSDDASVVDVSTMKELVRLETGREPYGVAASPDGNRALITSRLAVIAKPNTPPASELTIIDPVRARVVARASLDSAHLSEAVAAVPQRSWVVAPVVRVRNLVPITQVAHGWVMSSGLAIADARGERVVQMPLDEANAYYADPGGLVVDAKGERAYVASGGGDAILVVDLARLARWLEQADTGAKQEAIRNLELSAQYVVARIPTRRNPRQLALSADGETLYVAERLVDSILVIHTRDLSVAGRIALGDGGDGDPIRRGERMFTTASKTFQHEFSCRSCHPDGHVDGLNYDFDGDGIGDNFLDNRSLQGLAGTWPFKWNGKNPSLKIQCGPRFAKVLMRTDPFTDAELNDLTAFVLSLPPARTVPASQVGQPLTEPQERGREIFYATKTSEGKEIPKERRCFTCHMPPVYTNHQKTKIGTKGPYDLTDEFDTPHLLGIAASAPYLHDGRAKTLEELWTLYQTNDLHGVSSYMNKQQLNDLVAFLKTL